MAQLGFTFFPKDWWTSDSFYAMNPFERYIYLELLFMIYDNEGSVKSNKVMVESRLRTTIKDDVWSKITDLFVKDGDMLTHGSVDKRLKKAVSSRENGKLGGAPKGNNNAKKQPKQPTETTQNNPPYKEKEKEKEKRNDDDNSAEKTTSSSIVGIGKVHELLDLENSSFAMIACRKTLYSVEELKPFIKLFAADQRGVGKLAWQNESDLKNHFINWVKKQPKQLSNSFLASN